MRPNRIFQIGKLKMRASVHVKYTSQLLPESEILPIHGY